MTHKNSLTSLITKSAFLGGFLVTVPLLGSVVVFDTRPHGSWEETPPTSLAPTQVPNGIQVSNITRGPGLSPNNLNYGFSSNGWNNPTGEGGANVEATLESAIAQGNYYELSFTVDPGYTLSLLTLDYRHRRSTTATSGTRLGSYEWQYSFDGFATDGTAFFIGAFAPDEGPGDGVTHPTIALSEVAAFQELPEGTELTMRLFAFGATPTATNTFAFGRALSNLSGFQGEILDPNLPTGGPVFGVSVIPEPSTYAFMVGGLVLAFAIRRRLRCKASL